DAWKTGDLDSMYTYFSAETKKNMDKKEFVERYEKLTSDLEIKPSDIKLPDKEDVQKDNKQTARLSVSAKIGTIAGDIPLEKEAIMKLEETEEGEAWMIDWDPSYFLPNLEEGDKVRIQTLDGKRGRIFDRNGSSLA